MSLQVVKLHSVSYDISIGEIDYKFVTDYKSKRTTLSWFDTSSNTHRYCTLDQYLTLNSHDPQETIDKFFKLLMLQ